MENNLIINPNFKNLIPPLTPEEYSNLENSIKSEGCRDSIVVWKETIIDGHNRFKICSEYNIPFNVIKKDFDSIEDIKLWMIDNQKGRRNLTDGWKFELEQSKKEILLIKGKENMILGGAQKLGLSIIDKPYISKHNTRKEIAKDLGWSSGKVATADIVWEKASEEVKEQVKLGEKTFNEVYSDIKKEQRLEKISKQREELQKEALEQPKGNYDVIVMDVPWNYQDDSIYDADGFRGTCPYPTMSIEEIKKINIPAKDNCVLWFWTTNKHIFYCKDILESWGFEIKSILTWNKEHIGIGRWLRSQTEHCILAVKGKPYFNNTKWSTLISEKRTEHSTKPKIFYKIVEEICAGRKLDYFARKKRDGWDVYGDEIREVGE